MITKLSVIWIIGLRTIDLIDIIEYTGSIVRVRYGTWYVNNPGKDFILVLKNQILSSMDI